MRLHVPCLLFFFSADADSCACPPYLPSVTLLLPLLVFFCYFDLRLAVTIAAAPSKTSPTSPETDPTTEPQPQPFLPLVGVSFDPSGCPSSGAPPFAVYLAYSVRSVGLS